MGGVTLPVHKQVTKGIKDAIIILLGPPISQKYLPFVDRIFNTVESLLMNIICMK